MSDLLTVCTVKGESGGYGFAHWGRKTRAEAIELTRRQRLTMFRGQGVDQLRKHLRRQK